MQRSPFEMFRQETSPKAASRTSSTSLTRDAHAAWLIIAPGPAYLRDDFPASTGSERLHGTHATRPRFPGPRRQLTGTKIAIEQLRNFFNRAWLSDLIQRSEQVFFKAPVVWVSVESP